MNRKMNNSKYLKTFLEDNVSERYTKEKILLSAP